EQLSEAERETMETHLFECIPCQQALERLSQSDPMGRHFIWGRPRSGGSPLTGRQGSGAYPGPAQRRNMLPRSPRRPAVPWVIGVDDWPSITIASRSALCRCDCREPPVDDLKLTSPGPIQLKLQPHSLANTLPQRISHHEMKSVQGEGDLGVVNLAHDEKSRRFVAVKIRNAGVLTRAQVADPFLESIRLRRTLGALLSHSHPHDAASSRAQSRVPCGCLTFTGRVDAQSLECHLWARAG